MRKLVTIGGYGYTEASFVAALKAANVGALVDIRQRRGMRGSKYAFLNSARLQSLMAQSGIRYVHMKELAPTSTIRDVQKGADRQASTSKHARTQLSPEFVEAYQRDILSGFDAALLDVHVGNDTEVVALFCVEGQPAACHRSLAAQKIAAERDLPVEHLTP